MARIFIAIALLTSVSHAAEPLACAPRTVMLKTLLDKYHESPVGIGMAGKDHVMTFTQSLTGTWTMLATKRGGETCIVGAGTGWETIGVALAPGKDS